MPPCFFRFSKTAKFIQISCEQMKKSLLKGCVFFVIVSFLSCINESFLLGILGPVGGDVLVVGPVTWVHKTHKLRAPKIQYNDLVLYSCRLGLQLTNMSDNLDFIYFHNMGHKWYQDFHSLFYLWFQAIPSLGHSWVQAGHSLVHLW